jgi:hypothetical protein
VRKKAGGGGFLSFGSLITENHLRLIYILGAAMIVLVALMGITGGFAKKGAIPENMSFTNTTAAVQEPASSTLFWAGFLVIGSVLWRMFCELFAVLSRVHGAPQPDDEAAFDEDMAEYASGGIAAPGGTGSGQMVECPKCHKIVGIEDLRVCEHCGVQGCSNCIRPMGVLKKTLTCRECFEGQ